jgi:hypothetical protein
MKISQVAYRRNCQMKKTTLLFFILTLEFLIFQNAYSEILFAQGKTLDHHTRRAVLWKFHTISIDSSTGIDLRNIRPGFYLDSNAGKLVVVDSVLREDFYSKKKFFLYGKEKLNELKPNTYYLILTLAGCDDDKEEFWLFYPGKDNLLLDTPENRKILSKKFDELKVKYDMRSSDWGGMGNIDGREIRKKKHDVEK